MALDFSKLNQIGAHPLPENTDKRPETPAQATESDTPNPFTKEGIRAARAAAEAQEKARKEAEEQAKAEAERAKEQRRKDRAKAKAESARIEKEQTQSVYKAHQEAISKVQTKQAALLIAMREGKPLEDVLMLAVEMADLLTSSGGVITTNARNYLTKYKSED